jgi:hypothetical protein
MSQRLSVAVLLLLAVGLAGCGGDDDDDDKKKASGKEPTSNGVAEMSPTRILRTALKANRAAEDVVYTGKLSYYFPVGVRAFEATIKATGSSCIEDLTSDQLGRLTTRVVGDRTYARGSARAMSEVLELPASYVEIIGKRWVTGRRDDVVACTRVGIVTEALDVASCKPGGEGEVNGTPTVAVRCIKDAIQVRVDVATVGKPLILKMAEDGPSGDSLTLVEADSGIHIEAPPKRDVIDTSALR